MASLNGDGTMGPRLMESVALIILDFIMLHSDVSLQHAIIMQNPYAGPPYDWYHIHNVIGAACVVIPHEIFRNCLRHPRTNEGCSVSIQLVGKELRKLVEQEEQNPGFSSSNSHSHGFISLPELRFVFEVMLWHNLRASKLVELLAKMRDERKASEPAKKQTSKPAETQSSGPANKRSSESANNQSSRPASNLDIQERFLHDLQMYFENDPLSAPKWFKMSSQQKCNKLVSVTGFLAKGLPEMARYWSFRQPGVSRVYAMATFSDRETKIQFFGLNKIKMVIAAAMEEAARHWSEERQRMGGLSPLRHGQSTLARPRSADMRMLVLEQAAQRLREDGNDW